MKGNVPRLRQEIDLKPGGAPWSCENSRWLGTHPTQSQKGSPGEGGVPYFSSSESECPWTSRLQPGARPSAQKASNCGQMRAQRPRVLEVTDLSDLPSPGCAVHRMGWWASQPGALITGQLYWEGTQVAQGARLALLPSPGIQASPTCSAISPASAGGQGSLGYRQGTGRGVGAAAGLSAPPHPHFSLCPGLLHPSRPSMQALGTSRRLRAPFLRTPFGSQTSLLRIPQTPRKAASAPFWQEGQPRPSPGSPTGSRGLKASHSVT